MNHYDYEQRIKREEEILDFIDVIRNLTIQNIDHNYFHLDTLTEQTMQSCADEIVNLISISHTKLEGIVYNNILQEAIRNFVIDFIKHEHDDLISMGSASSNYWNKMLDSRALLINILRNNQKK